MSRAISSTSRPSRLFSSRKASIESTKASTFNSCAMARMDFRVHDPDWFYGKPLDTRQIVFGAGPGSHPEPVPAWLQTLDRYARP